MAVSLKPNPGGFVSPTGTLPSEASRTGLSSRWLVRVSARLWARRARAARISGLWLASQAVRRELSRNSAGTDARTVLGAATSASAAAAGAGRKRTTDRANRAQE